LGILTSIQTKGQIISSPDNLILDLTNIEFGNSIINAAGTNITTDSFSFSGIINITKPDSTIRLSYFNVSLDDLDTINIDGTKISNPIADIYLADSTFILDFNAKLDTLASANVGLTGIFNRDNIMLDVKKLNLDYLNKIIITNDNIGRIKLDNSSFLVDNLILKGNNQEKISIVGYADTNSIEKLAIEASNLQLKHFKDILPMNIREILKDIDFSIEKSSMEISGNLNAPVYHFTLNTNDIISKNKQIGALIADLNYKNLNMTGRIEMLSDNYGELPPLRLDLQKFPIDLSFTDNLGKREGEFLAVFGLDSLNMQVIEPFQPYIKNIKGFANAQIKVNGSDLEDYKINGYINTNDLNFKLMQNNLDYSVNSKISFNDTKIKIDTLNIVNFGTKNSARLKGNLNFAQNTVTDLNLNLKADNFSLLEEHSKLVNPQFFGKVSISTKNEGVNLIGDPDKLNIIGDLQVNPSNLTIANLSSSNVVTQTNFDYVLKDEKRIFTVVTTTDSLVKPIEKKVQTTNSSVPDINVNVFIPKSVNLKIELGAIGEIIAVLGTTDPTIPLKYVMSDSKPDGQLFGELIIKNGSTLNSYKTMTATGTISFNTGRLDAPELNLTARYDGKIDENSNPIKYSVFIYITGTPELPKVRFDYTINNLSPQGEQKKIEESALYLLLFGTLPGSSEIIDPAVVSKLGSAGISSIASRSISDLLLKTGVIESADVQLNSEDFEKTKIKLKGKLFGSMNWSFGGNVADLTKNNQIVIEIPLSVDSKTFNQVVWLMSYSTNLNSTIIDPDEKNWEIKFRIGGSW
jgi:hypothetical protein